jgi:hypothetical protein
LCTWRITRAETASNSHGCAVFFRLADDAKRVLAIRRCCLADKIALDFPASDFPKIWFVARATTFARYVPIARNAPMLLPRLRWHLE